MIKYYAICCDRCIKELFKDIKPKIDFYSLNGETKFKGCPHLYILSDDDKNLRDLKEKTNVK